ncbi:ZIP family metal transporter [Halogeometricum limi]|uniref:Zinc transporter, ZIP family n=1 Tax=Halogeometricum limi TaxID=555875 RepID=A0A1I6FQR3_9EURY|nr:hypothetical protein [Halogeometricum limi]SFR32292.1 zinc transporter, ZIP family [Halogeometricum limi]
MVGPLVFGVAASSSLVFGSIAGAYWDPPEWLTGSLVAFASGALIVALAFELFEHAFETAGLAVASAGLLAGGAVFTVVDHLLDEVYGTDSSGLGLLASVTLDGVPENLALGVALIGQASPFALLAAIFASNFPEALSGAKDVADEASKLYTVSIWVGAAALLAAAVVVGNRVFASTAEVPLAVVRAFAGGSVVASLTTEVMPEAFEEGGDYVGFATAVGFVLAFALK